MSALLGAIFMKTRAQKEQTVQQLTEKLGRSKAIVFTDYKGMTMSQLSSLRDTLAEQDAQLAVTKNTLLKIALRESGKPIEDNFEGPVATLFAYSDEITPLKSLVKALKDNGIGKIKSGILGDQFLDENRIKQLASLPSKDELRGKTVGVLAAPLQGMVGVLQANLRNLVYVFEQIRKSKGGEA